MLIIQVLDERSTSTQDASRLAIQSRSADTQTSAQSCLAVQLDKNPELKATFLDAIGQAYLEYGSHEQAIATFNEAVALRRSVFGDSHPLVAETQRQLASALRHASRLDEAASALTSALQIFEQYFGKSSVPYCEAQIELAAISLAANQLDDARRYAAESYETLNARGDIRALHCLDVQARVVNVCAAGDRGKQLEAAQIYSTILKDSRLNDAHAWRAFFVHNEGTILHELGEYEAAKRNFDAVIAAWTEEAGDTRPAVIDALISRGRTLRELRDLKGARRDIETALQRDREYRGSRHPYVAYDLVCLARLLMEEGCSSHAAAAEQALDEAISIYRERGMEQHAYLEVALRRRFALLGNAKDKSEADQIRAAVEKSCSAAVQQCK